MCCKIECKWVRKKKTFRPLAASYWRCCGRFFAFQSCFHSLKIETGRQKTQKTDTDLVWLTAHGQHLRYRPFWLHTERFATRTWATLSHLGCCQLSVFWHVLTGEKKRKRMPRSHGWGVSNARTGNWFAFAVQQQVRALGSPKSPCSFPSLFSYVSQDPNRLGCEEPPESIEALRCIR